MTHGTPLADADLLPRARAFADYWLSLPKTDLIPHRRDFDPTALSSVLDTFLIFEITDPDHFLIRLAGTTVTETYGREITGRNYVDFHSPDGRPVARAAMTLVATQPCGKLVRQRAKDGTGGERISDSFGLPMRDNRGRATLLYYQVDNLRFPTHKVREERRFVSKKTVTRDFLDIGAGVPAFPLVGNLD
jgi:hypothetical protein